MYIKSYVWGKEGKGYVQRGQRNKKDDKFCPPHKIQLSHRDCLYSAMWREAEVKGEVFMKDVFEIEVFFFTYSTVKCTLSII